MIKNLFTILVLSVFINSCNSKKNSDSEFSDPIYKFGINIDTLLIHNDTISFGQSLSQILSDFSISNLILDKLSKQSRNTEFDLRLLKADSPYSVIYTNDTLNNPHAKFFIYEINKVDFIVYDLVQLNFYKDKKEVDTRIIYDAGIIQKGSSFFLSGAEVGMSDRLCEIISDEIYCWTLDFRQVQPGDKFKVIYEANYINKEFVGVGKVLAVYFSHLNNDFYAFPYNDRGFDDYFDNDGKNLRKFFLKTPVKNSRISSKFSKKRFHPVQKRWKSHKGTDYAAPRGTPIWSTADGIVIVSKYNKYNGNYVKIRHNNVYTTQYLHMNKIAKGIKNGVRVKQGQVIGYVGSTGLATGPHVCYRFWKHGKQVDPFRVKLPPSDPISQKSKIGFNNIKDSLKNILDSITFNNIEN
tara:strand:- start:1599 stop:2828 length:1230 start_codon:yes stop_codon:yes gene_type:complete